MSAPGSERGPISWMVRNRVPANLLMLFFLIGGVFAFRSITQEVFPDVQENIVVVSVEYPGASPEEIEQGIILAVEESLTGLAGIYEVTSTASEGGGQVRVELIEGFNPVQVYQDIKSQVDRIITFPEEAERPEVYLQVRRREVIELALYGNAEDKVLRALAERVRDQLLQDPGITQVELSGTRDLEIAIEVPLANLRRYGLTLDELAGRIKRSSVEMPGGGIKTESGEVLVRMTERRDYGREFSRLPVITAADGSEVRLGDIAVISDGLAEVTRFATYNGMPAVMIEVYRIGEQTPVAVAEAAKRMIEEIRPTLPEGVDLAVRWNSADIFQQRADLLIKNGALGLVLVIALLGVFLELRLAFWVMMSIPISFLGSLLLMPMTGLSINMITMFSYILALGIVVDSAIVVGENIYRRYQEGLPALDAASSGVAEVSTPIAYSILTNVAAFVPIYLLSGMMGRVLGMLPIVVISVFMISWVVSIFILPSQLGHHRERQRRGLNRWLHERQQGFNAGFRRWIETRYAPFLSWGLDHRFLVVAAAVAALAVTVGYVASGRMGFETFPRVESDYAYVTVSLPYGSPIARTAEIAAGMEAEAREVAAKTGHPELIEGVFCRIGLTGAHDLECRTYLAPPEIRNKILGTQAFVDNWRKKVGPIKGADYVRFMSDRGGPGSGSALTIELSHSNVKTLEKAATELGQALEAFPRVTDIDDGFQYGKEQLSFKMKPEGESLGLSASEVARQVRSAFEGIKVIRQQRGRNELTVRLRLPEQERISEGDLEAMILKTPAGGEVPLRDIVEVNRGRAYTAITHRNGRRTMTVTADVTPRAATGQVIDAVETEILPTLIRRHPGLTFSYQGRQAEDRKSMGDLWRSVPMVLIAIYALLAIPFKSYVQPLIVMVSIPFGVVGAVVGHLIMGYSLSLMGVIGIVALAGVVVNNALVLLDFVNRRREEGAALKPALIDAGVKRFRPIILTTLTTFFGLAPMIFETSRQARFLIPLALSLGYGLIFATLVTLLLVPALYAIMEDVRGLFYKDGDRS